MIKIKLCSPEFLAEFVNICSKYDCDINVDDGNTMIDAKSIIGVNIPEEFPSAVR